MAQLLTKRVQTLTQSEDNHDQEIVALYEKVPDLRASYDAFLVMGINDGDDDIARK